MKDAIQPINHQPTATPVAGPEDCSPTRRPSMTSQILRRELCHKRGCILTCYDNGRKRFRAAPIGQRTDETVPAGLAPNDHADPARRTAKPS